MAAEQQGDCTHTGRSRNWLPRRGRPVELGRIAGAELIPPRGIVPKPAPERSTGCHVLGPGIQAEVRFLDAARPQPLYEESCSVSRLGGFINALKLDHGSASLPPASVSAWRP